jgi:hypothetical protein
MGFNITNQLLNRSFAFTLQWKKKWESSEREYQLFVHLKKAYGSVRREVFYSIVIEFGEHMKLVRLIKMCLNKMNNKVRIGRHLSDTFPVQNGLKQGDSLSPLLFKFAIEYAIRKVQENQVGMKLNGTHQLLVYADDVNLLGDTLHTMKKIETSIDASKEVGLQRSTEKTKYILLSRHQEEGGKSCHKIDNGCFEKFGTFQIYGNESNKLNFKNADFWDEAR